MLYFFNMAGGPYHVDKVGHEFATIEAARTEAVKFTGEVLRDHPALLWRDQELRVEVSDAEGLLLFTIMVLGIDAPAADRPHPRA